jgi:hypothetical protein
MDFRGSNGDPPLLRIPTSEEGPSAACMIQRIAMPIFGSRVSSRLDCAERILSANVDHGSIVRQQEMLPGPGTRSQRFRVEVQEGLEVLISGGLTETYAGGQGMRVKWRRLADALVRILVRCKDVEDL